MKSVLKKISLALVLVLIVPFFTACGQKTIEYTGSALTDGTVGVAYSQSVATAEAEDVDITITYTVKEGDGLDELPEGLTLSEAGVLSGTPAANAEGDYVLTIIAGAKGYKDAEAEFTVSIKKAAISYSGTTLPAARRGVANYSASVKTATTPVSAVIAYSLKSGNSPPSGLSFANGDITGTPETAVTAHKFTVVAKAVGFDDVEAEFTITVAKSEFTYSGTSFTGKVSDPFSESVAFATGYGSPAVTYSLKAGSTLPGGLTLDPLGGGNISGTPTAEVTAHEFTVIASATGFDDKETVFNITILEAVAVVPTISYAAISLTDGNQNEAYSSKSVANATASIGTPSITYTITSGRLPMGMDFSNGTISGTPTEFGEFTFTVTAAAAGYLSASAEFTLEIARARKEFIMESEDVDFSGKSGVGLSGSRDGTAMIEADTGRNASNGRFVSYCHGIGLFFEYNFSSDIATTATLRLRLANDAGSTVYGFDHNAMMVRINETVLEYGPYDIDDSAFEDFFITDEMPIKAGPNVLRLQILDNDLLPDQGGDAGTAECFGPMFDCVKIYSIATLSWVPELYNY